MSDPTALPNFPPPAQVRPLRGRVLDILQDLGAAPDIDQDGDVEFTVEGQRMFVRCADPEQPGQVAVLRIFGQWQIQAPAPSDQLELLQRCNDMTLQLNIIKVGIVGESLLVSGEHLVEEHSNLPGMVQLTISIILQTVGMWFQSWQPDAGPDAPGEGARS